ncbi:MAG TPA: hypothetical protein VKB88_02815 [Bryobacteraceae bacterium]|nr:hypothetical protein [Bryobacteraceae bacterium]
MRKLLRKVLALSLLSLTFLSPALLAQQRHGKKGGVAGGKHGKRGGGGHSPAKKGGGQ